MRQDFSNFYIDKNNQDAFDIIQKIADKGKIDYSIILLCGKNGVEKTHLMVALKEKIKDKSNVVRISSNQFMEMLKSKTLGSLYNLDILIIEDIQFFYFHFKSRK